MRRVDRFSEEADLKLNRSKCCITIIDRRNATPKMLQHIDDMQLKDEVVYLEVSVSNMGKSKYEIKEEQAWREMLLHLYLECWKITILATRFRNV